MQRYFEGHEGRRILPRHDAGTRNNTVEPERIDLALYSVQSILVECEVIANAEGQMVIVGATCAVDTKRCNE